MAHWRDSARNVRFFGIDFRATFPLLFLIFKLASLWTWVFAILATLFFALLEKWGFTVGVFLRWLRAYIAGPRKIAQPWWKE
jgi:intracellular multiplication protein IcmT